MASGTSPLLQKIFFGWASRTLSISSALQTLSYIATHHTPVQPRIVVFPLLAHLTGTAIFALQTSLRTWPACLGLQSLVYKVESLSAPDAVGIVNTFCTVIPTQIAFFVIVEIPLHTFLAIINIMTNFAMRYASLALLQIVQKISIQATRASSPVSTSKTIIEFISA